MQAPVLVLNTKTKRENGRQAQLANIVAGKTVADLVRTCLGPKAMLKMLIDPTFGVTLTSDGNAVLRDISVDHPAAKYVVELARAQDEAVGDGTTSVVVLAGEVLQVAETWISRGVHPTVIIAGFLSALDDGVAALRGAARSVDLTKDADVLSVVGATVGTTFMRGWSDVLCQLAIDAVKVVGGGSLAGAGDADTKRYARVEKVPGGSFEESRIVRGIVLNKDVVHGGMRRRIENPRVVLLDCGLEYTKGESQTDVEVTDAASLGKLLEQEEAYVKKLCEAVVRARPDVVVTEKGISDIAQHYLHKAGVSALRRGRKNDLLRLARATGGRVVTRPEELTEGDVGHAGLFEVRKLGDEYYAFIEGCAGAACTVLLRGGVKDTLNEAERNLQDAISACRALAGSPQVVPGGGAAEMHVAAALMRGARGVAGAQQAAYAAVGTALEVIPRTLAANCGADVVSVVTELRAKHASGQSTWGVDGMTGELRDMALAGGIWEPLEVKAQCLKSAVVAACTLLRVDDVVSGIKNKNGGNGQGAANPNIPAAPMPHGL